MVIEVGRKNFKDVLPKIEHAVMNADFIAIDTEFSGLTCNDFCKPSLFDSSSDRYNKLRKSVQQFTLSQIGLSVFTGRLSENTNSFTAQTFLFHVCPTSFGFHDERFCLQASSVEFLCKHKFDFNKWLYEGISYMNITQEQLLKQELKSGMLDSAVERCVDHRHMQTVCSKVAAWIPTSKVGDFLNLSVSEDLSLHLLHKDLRARFPQVWTSINPFDQFVVERVTSEQRQVLEKAGKEPGISHNQQYLEEMLGFTHVFRILQRSQKPIVGHNMLMDLLFLYEKFHKPLPEHYEDFKVEIHKLFPSVYDTKHMSYQAKNTLDCMKNSWFGGLKELYDLVNSKFVLNTALCQPSIKSEGEGQRDKIHEAGYDAFLCGSVFVRLCHLLYAKSINSMEITCCRFQDYRPSVQRFCNCINVIRAVVNHLKLDAPDPPSVRPPLLYVTSGKSGVKLYPEQMASWFSVYGTVDFELMDSSRAVVATSSYAVARDILYAFKEHSQVNVTKYRYWQHSRTAHNIWWGSLTVATATSLLLLYNALR